MCKRFFVEVVGLGEDGKEKLIGAGISESSIMVVDDSMQPLQKAILKATGVSFERMRSKSSERMVVTARVIYAHFARIEGQTNSEIRANIAKDARSFYYYLNKYYDLIRFDKCFKRVVDNVIELLKKDVNWHPVELKKIVPSKKLSKKMAKKKEKKQKLKLKEEEIKKIIENRQLKIDFKNGN